MTKRFNPLKPTAKAKAPAPTPLKKGEIVTPPPVGPSPILKENAEKDGIELHFTKRPGPFVLKLLHGTKSLPCEQRWHFHWKSKFWYAKQNKETRKFAGMLIAHTERGELKPDPPTEMPVAARREVSPMSIEIIDDNQTFPRSKMDEDPSGNVVPVVFAPEKPKPQIKPKYSWRHRSRYTAE